MINLQRQWFKKCDKMIQMIHSGNYAVKFGQNAVKIGVKHNWFYLFNKDMNCLLNCIFSYYFLCAIVMKE
jgi:hypothetical protein